MTPKLLSRLPVIKWISIVALIVLVVVGGWFVSSYQSFWHFLQENLGQVSGYALLVVLILYVSFSLIEYFVEKNVRLNRWLEEVYRITREVQAEEREETLLEHAMRHILEVFEFDRAVFFLAADGGRISRSAAGSASPTPQVPMSLTSAPSAGVPDAGRLDAKPHLGFEEGRTPRGHIDLKRDSPISHAVNAGTPKVYENVGENAFDRELILGGEDNPKPERFAVIPLRQEGRTVGALYVDTVTPKRIHARIDSAVMRLLGTYMDQVSVVMERVRLLNREKDLSKTLSIKIEEALGRERELEEKLRLSETLAALGEMAASLTHEIKNPLGGLDMYARLLQRDLTASKATTEETKDLVEKILDGVKTLNTIVGNLLGYARVARREMNDQISIADVIGAAADFAKSEIERLGVTFKCDVPAGLKVIGNIDQLRQVFLNLLLNGVQSMHETGGALTVRALKKESQAVNGTRTWVVTEITDTGVGMTEEQKSRIFEDFYTTREKGTGLGLAISRKIVKVHGGEITFESEWKKGSIFRVYLPAAAVPAAKKTDARPDKTRSR